MTASAVLWLRDRRELALTDAVTSFCRTSAAASRRRHHPPPAHAHVGPARHAPGKHRAPPTARAPVGVRGSNLPHATALPTRREGQLPEHGHPAGGGIVEKVSGEPMPGFMARTIFDPLGMRQTSFGLGGRRIADTAQCQVPEAERSDWDWNSPYWRNLGSPGAAPTRPRAISDVPGGLRLPGRRRVARPRRARCAPSRQARCGQASVWAGSASRGFRPDLLRGDVRPLRFDRHADLARSGNGHDLRRPHDQTGHGFQVESSAPCVRDHWTDERLMTG